MKEDLTITGQYNGQERDEKKTFGNRLETSFAINIKTIDKMM